MQKWTAKMESTRKTGKGEPGLQKSTIEKVNGQQESQSQQSTPSDDVNNVA